MDWEFIKQFGFPIAVAVYLLHEQRESRKEASAERDRLTDRINKLETQHFQIQRDIAMTLRETNRLVKRIFNIVDRNDGGDGGGGDMVPTDATQESDSKATISDIFRSVKK